MAFSCRVVVKSRRGRLALGGPLVPCITHDRRSAWPRLHGRRPVPLPASRSSVTEASQGLTTPLAAMTTSRSARDRGYSTGTRPARGI